MPKTVTPKPMPVTDTPGRVDPMPDAPMQYKERMGRMQVNPGKPPIDGTGDK